MQNDHLFVGQFDVTQLVREYGTPLYVYDGAVIQRNYQKITGSIPYYPKEIHYPLMCNSNPHILALILKLGGYIQANSIKEIELARSAGFPKENISVTTTNIGKEDMTFYIQEGLQLNLDSLEEVERYGELVEQCRRQGFPINPQIGVRLFVHIQPAGYQVTNQPHPIKPRVGIKEEKFTIVKTLAQKYGLKITGVHGYMASNVINVAPFFKLNSYLVHCAKQFDDLEYINVGAGFGIPSRPNAGSFDWQSYGLSLSALMESVSWHFKREIHLKLEPGRSLIGDAGVLLARVTNIKDMDSWVQVGVDCGFGEFARPYIYGAEGAGYHSIVVANKLNEPSVKKYTICGNSVLQQDFLAEDRQLPEVELDDIIAFLNTGAYGSSMMSLFPGRERPREVLVLGGKLQT